MGGVSKCTERRVSRQMQAILLLAEHPLLSPILNPIINVERESVDFSRVNYGALSGGTKTAMSWAQCIWADEVVPGIRDPFEGFGVLSHELQCLLVTALMHRWS